MEQHENVLTIPADELKRQRRNEYMRVYMKRRRREHPEEERRKGREQARRWREANPERAAAIQLRYYEKLAKNGGKTL